MLFQTVSLGQGGNPENRGLERKVGWFIKTGPSKEEKKKKKKNKRPCRAFDNGCLRQNEDGFGKRSGKRKRLRCGTTII